MSDGPVNVRYRRPEAMQAWQVTAENGAAVARWCAGTLHDDGAIGVNTAYDDWAIADVGDWLVKRDDRFVALPPEAFAQHYEVVPR